MSKAMPVKNREQRGFICPRCGCRHFIVIYTRPLSDAKILRKRECRYCKRQMMTYETPI